MTQVAFYRYAPHAMPFAVVVLEAIGVDDIRRGTVGRVRTASALISSATVLPLCREIWETARQ